MRGQDQGYPWFQLHELIVALQPSLAIALQNRDRLEIGMRMRGGLVTGRRILNADADGGRALCVPDQRQIGRSTFERLRLDVAVADNWHCRISHYCGRAQGCRFDSASDPFPTVRAVLV